MVTGVAQPKVRTETVNGATLSTTNLAWFTSGLYLKTLQKETTGQPPEIERG
jgi:hypothetical protein